MNLNKNYYSILGVKKTDDEKTIKKAYYKLSFTNHPDKGGNPVLFGEMTEAYDVLCGEQRTEYDMKSKFGNNYNEYFELFELNVEFDYQKENTKYQNFKKDLIDIYIKISEDFDGTVEYERMVKCKTCDGTGKDLSSKIVIKDKEGKILKTFDADDGCDFCEGTGKDPVYNMTCTFCQGAGKVGLTPCKNCKGEKRILGKQKLSGVKLTGKETKIESMGNCSKNVTGQVGHLYLVKS